MSESSMPFDHRPDAELGAALRAALEPGAPAPFVTRVVDALERAGPVRTWDVLAAWARIGIATAAAAALIAGFVVGRERRGAAAPDEVAVASAGEGAALMLSSPRAPDASIVFTSLVNRGR